MPRYILEISQTQTWPLYFLWWNAWTNRSNAEPGSAWSSPVKNRSHGLSPRCWWKLPRNGKTIECMSGSTKSMWLQHEFTEKMLLYQIKCTSDSMKSMCPQHEFTEKMLLYPKILFIYPQMPVSLVSVTVGFQDKKYFSKAFKKFFGSSPSKFWD